jgi:hypothetical protein
MSDEINLPTPVNIKDFANETDESHNIINEKELLNVLRNKSQSTSERFATDIEEMQRIGETYKVLFLCFPSISDWFSTNFVKTEYSKLIKDFNIKDDYAFERAPAKFRIKIEISDYVRFSHPSYYEALPFLLSEDGIPTKINDEIFSNVLIKLRDDNFAAGDVAKTIASNFNKFPNDVRDLLFNMANDTIVYEAVAEAIQSNFDKLPSDVSYKLFMNLTNNDYRFWNMVGAVSNSIALAFNNLPENVRDLLFKMADNGSAAMIISRTIVDNFDKLPENVRNELRIKNKKGEIEGKVRRKKECLTTSNYVLIIGRPVIV